MRYTKYASRKFILSLVVIGIATGLLLFDCLNGDQFVRLVMATAGVFMGANAMSKFSQKGD